MLSLFYYRETSTKASLFFRLLNNQIILGGMHMKQVFFILDRKVTEQLTINLY